MKSLKYITALSVSLMLALMLCCPQTLAAGRQLINSEINALIKIYAPEGYEHTYLKKLFSNPRVQYVPKLVRMLVIPPDFSANYERFKQKPAIDQARAFRRYWRTCLGRAAAMHGVDPDIIVAILLVETSLGKNPGRSPVLSVFATLLLENSLYRDGFSKSLDGNARREHYLKRLDEKAVWAREELHALLKMNQKKSIDVCGLKGSYAGAFGIPQFLPSSYLKWAQSDTEKRSPNLFYMPHAIMSVANFLKAHGWRKDLTEKEKRAVIWHYNRSSTYVDTVLEIAKQINSKKAVQHFSN